MKVETREEGDLLITMGAGDVTQVGPEFIDYCSKAESACTPIP